MTIVAFLQNQWFKDPNKMRTLLERMIKMDPARGRERFIRTWLLWSCPTGKRLTRAFGKDLCAQIVWEEGSAEIGGKSSTVFKPDERHIQNVIHKHKPEIILAFGKVVIPALKSILRCSPFYRVPMLIVGPHPAARGSFVVQDLSDMVQALKEQM